jgi:hypothetical protein
VRNATRHQEFDPRLRIVGNGLRLAVAAILLWIDATATHLAASPPSTFSVTLDWDASTSTDIAGYNVYYGAASGSYTQMVSVGKATQTTITGLTAVTTYFFAVTASDSVGLESSYSDEASLLVPGPQPILSLVRAGTESALLWPTNFPGYTLQYSSNPIGEWTNLTSDPSVSGSNFAYTNTTSTALRWYRLKK